MRTTHDAWNRLVRVAQQFWGIRYIDDAVARRIDGNADGDYDDTESAQNPDGTWFYLTDVQFSVVALLTDTAELAERVVYDAYGRARHRWFTDLDGDGDADNNDFFAFLAGAGQAALPYGLISDPLGPDNPIGYDGYVFAPEAGLNVPTGSPQPQAVGAYVVRFRWYLPELGRWLQKDPAGYVDGMVLFEFVGSNPVWLINPLGLMCAPPPDEFDAIGIGTALDRQVSRNGRLHWIEAHALTSDESLLRNIGKAMGRAECIAECIATDPEALVGIVSEAGWNLGKDRLVELGKLTGLLLWLDFDDGKPELDWRQVAEDAVELGDRLDARFTARRIRDQCLADRHIRESIELWRRNGGRTPSDLLEYARNLDRVDAQARAVARGRVFRSQLASIFRHGTRVAAPIEATLTVWEFGEKVWEQIQSQCSQCFESGCDN